MTDVIDQLAGIEPGSRLDAIRRHRPEARSNADASYRALFEPADPSELSLPERFAVATAVAGFHRSPAIGRFYAEGLDRAGDAPIREALEAVTRAGITEGPYGSYPNGPLSGENRDGLAFRVPDGARGPLGPRLAAAIEHSHRLVFHPRDSAPEHLQALLDAGLSTTAIVTLSQLVSFLSFQIRVVAGLEALAAAGKHPGERP